MRSRREVEGEREEDAKEDPKEDPKEDAKAGAKESLESNRIFARDFRQVSDAGLCIQIQNSSTGPRVAC